MVMTLQARPTTYRGIAMRSRLEARFAAFLDHCLVDWSYEPRAFRASAGEYLPDFQVGDRTFVEVKPATLDGNMPTWVDQAQRAREVLADAVPGSVFWVVRSDGFAVVFHAGQLVAKGDLFACDSCGQFTLTRRCSKCPCGAEFRAATEWLEWRGQ